MTMLSLIPVQIAGQQIEGMFVFIFGGIAGMIMVYFLQKALELANGYSRGVIGTKIAKSTAVQPDSPEVEALRRQLSAATADLQNYKKRTRREIDDAVHRSVGDMLVDFLPIADNLDRAISSMQPDADSQIAKGLAMVRDEFFSSLARHGITPIRSMGEVFSPDLHEAVQMAPSSGSPPGIIVAELERGYMRGDRLLRAARVVVTEAASDLIECAAGEPVIDEAPILANEILVVPEDAPLSADTDHNADGTSQGSDD